MSNRSLQAIPGVGVQLPNGDIWTGAKAAPRPDTVTDVVDPTSPEDAVMQMLMTQKGEEVSCVWCDLKFQRKDLNGLRDHVEKNHQTVTDNKEAENAALQVLAATALAGTK